MINTTEDFRKEYTRIAKMLFERGPEHLGTEDRYTVLAKLIMKEAFDRAGEKDEAAEEKKKVYYFSMEFLIGKLMDNYLLNLGIRKQVEEGLREMGIELEELLECEPDPGLGNGGLGRLAACFLDSLAALDIDGDGMGLRYKFGLFKQRIENGY